MIGAVHLLAVDREDDVALAHARLERRPVVLHEVDVRDHLDLLLALVVDAIALWLGCIGVVEGKFKFRLKCCFWWWGKFVLLVVD